MENSEHRERSRSRAERTVRTAGLPGEWVCVSAAKGACELEEVRRARIRMDFEMCERCL